MLRLLAICFLLWGTAVAQATETSTFALRDELNAFKELQQSKWESQKELQVKELDSQKALQVKDIEAVRQQITAVDKRVDDQLAQVGQSIDRFGILTALLSLCITVLLVFGGFLGYRNAKSEAKEAASDVAKASAQDWFDKQAVLLREQLEAIAQKAAQLHIEMDGHAQGVQARAADIARALDTAQESIGKTGAQTPSALADSTRVLVQRDLELKASSEDSYSFDDWNTRAHAAYTAGALEDAAYFWLKAARVANAVATSVAKVLVNRGITQGQLNQHEAEIATYDEVLRRFGEAAEPALREQVARALVNKGVTQGQLNQSEAAMATYDEALRRFGEAAEPVLREQVAMALLYKGITQGQLNQNEAEIATYDEVLRRFGEAAEPALREQVARALLYKGITQGQLNQNEAAMATYDEVLRRFGEAAEPALRETVARATVNKDDIQRQLNL
ncbi:tetratricopeptide repeat protein [Achromobacter pulmonis]|uniref:tetratricopeptide repeat protein n=1 Tax=Achromobacter pulmonis TaxID=1389932 RepID=UPI001582A3FA|nr:tetratricopeptide repeat protein [Achromobacter pulmonis]